MSRYWFSGWCGAFIKQAINWTNDYQEQRYIVAFSNFEESIFDFNMYWSFEELEAWLCNANWQIDLHCGQNNVNI